jgi:hypothetical protein
LYTALHDNFEENPLWTANELRAFAPSSRGQLSDEMVQATVDLFLDTFFRHAVRFCADTGLEPKSGIRATYREALATGSWSQAVLREAAQHMSENSDLTNMLSLALSEGALLLNAGAEVCTLIYDTESQKWAPFIHEFMVPMDSLITVDKIEKTQYRLGIAGYRSRSETEVLFYGSGLGRYMTRQRRNPYTREDQIRIQRPADEI